MTTSSERPEDKQSEADTKAETTSVTPADEVDPSAASEPAASEAAEASASTPTPPAEEPATVPVEAEVVMMESAEREAPPASVTASDPSVDEAGSAAISAEQAAAMEKDTRLASKYKAGQRLEVRLVQVSEKEAFVDFGGPAEGTIATAELLDAAGELRVQVGETFTAIIRKVDEPIEFTVGRSKGGDLLRMRELESAHQGNIPVQGKIRSTNKGGFEVDLNGVRAFCPFSQIDIIYCEKPEEHVGKEYPFEILAFERGGRNIVLSRRRLLAEEAKAAAMRTREHIAVGLVCEGTVRRLQPYGAFIDLGGIDGLVHVSEISRGHVADPRDVLKVGHRVQVKIIAIDDLGGPQERVSLSMKALESDPWEGAQTKWAPGSSVKGRVVRLTDFGAFVELAAGVDGLVHISEISTERIGHPAEVLVVDQMVDARILSVDPDGRRISLTLRPEGEERVQHARDDDRGERRGGGGGDTGRGRRQRPQREYEPESYTFGSEETTSEPAVNVNELEFDDALELLKQKFNRQ